MVFDLKKYQKEKTAQVLLRFQKDDTIYMALVKAASNENIKPTHYVKKAVLNQLKEDGYLHKKTDVEIKDRGRPISHPKK